MTRFRWYRRLLGGKWSLRYPDSPWFPKEWARMPDDDISPLEDHGPRRW